MTVVGFHELMAHAEQERYAVGYFECWNLESLMAAADAAESARSPILLGFSGIYLPHPQRLRTEPPGVYAALGLEVCREIAVPAGLVFNESPHLEKVLEAVQQGYGLVMFSDEGLTQDEQVDMVRQVVDAAHSAGAAVEGEASVLPGVGGDLDEVPDQVAFTEVQTALDFIDKTGVDAFAVSIGQMHLHGRREVQLDLERLGELHEAVDVPLVLHGASSVSRQDLAEAVQLGIRKINVGSALKQAYFKHLRAACADVDPGYNPYEVIGSGLSEDVLMAGRIALQREVEELIQLFGSTGKADSIG
ncbi:MAG: class II fructose-bisphosphate aldolase [Gammaproteobacteria bacterium]|nr:class II fructose-bisphosphate aldolase [Gammaproteobacteria bacterium]